MPKYLLIFLLLSILVLGIVYFVRPKYQEFTDLRARVEEKKLELQNKKEYFSQLAELSQKLNEYEPQLTKIKSALPPEPRAYNLLEFFEKESSINGLILENVNLEGVTSIKDSDIKKISISLSLSGTYPSFKNLLSTIQNNARLIEVESISFSSPEKGQIFSLNLEIRTHSY